jgi:hypothetical protein
MGPKEYTWLVSTYRPAELGPVESHILDNFIYNPQKSAYEIYKTFQEFSRDDKGKDFDYPGVYYTKPMAYKNVHKRIKRLAQLKDDIVVVVSVFAFVVTTVI